MGSSLIVREHNYVERAALQSWVDDCVHRDAAEHGSSYSGYWNMCRGPLQFDERQVHPSVAAAHDYIAHMHEKWGGLLAVPAWEQLQLPEAEAKADAALQALREQQNELTTLVVQQDTAIVRRAKQAKTKLRGCAKCGSRVNVEYLHATRCPVCSENLLRTPTDDKQRDAWKAKASALQARFEARMLKLLQAKYKTTDPTRKVWVVGGWCAS